MDRVYRLAKRSPYVLALLFSVALAGCGSGHPKTYAVSGRVTVAGKPLAVGDIQLIPETVAPSGGKGGDSQDKGAAPDKPTGPRGIDARGQIGADGRFQLSTFDENDGAAKGTYKVVVSATEKVGNQLRSLVPDRFSAPQTSDKTVTIDGATDALNIDLTWAPGEKPWSRPYREEKPQ